MPPRSAAAAYAPHTATMPTHPASRSPSRSVTGLEYALQLKRARRTTTSTHTRATRRAHPAHDPRLSRWTHKRRRLPRPPRPLRLLLSGARALCGTRLGSLAAPCSARFSVANYPTPVDALLAADWGVGEGGEGQVSDEMRARISSNNRDVWVRRAAAVGVRAPLLSVPVRASLPFPLHRHESLSLPTLASSRTSLFFFTYLFFLHRIARTYPSHLS
ncbi:hypothetical protein B0H19DRAFT_1369388 [Mycena capillaripes]|nr:hypothetical protein B0H19DRAFT_1369388 [Mycena capillaripes]